MKPVTFLCLLLGFLFSQTSSLRAQTFSLESVKSYPFPTELVSAATGSRIAWAFNEQGKRNVYVAEGPDYTPRKLTSYNEDDGQELTSLAISDDGKWVVYVRGGDHGSNWDDELPVNTLASPVPPKVQIWSVPFAGGEPKAIAEGDAPVISPKSDRIAFVKGGQVWIAPADGSSAAKSLFTVRGTTGSLQWSPDGSKLAFVCDRKDHAFVGVFTNETTPITWIAPSFSRDESPRWSPDGRQLVFVRTSGSGGAPDSILTRKHRPWAIWVADAVSGTGIPTLAGTQNAGRFRTHYARRHKPALGRSKPHCFSVVPGWLAALVFRTRVGRYTFTPYRRTIYGRAH